jgi:hypothetical protein
MINRRVCCWALIGPAVPKSQGERNLRFLSPLESLFFPQRGSELTSGNVFPPSRPSKLGWVAATTVLDVKGPLRRAKHRRALDVSAPFRQEGDRDGRLRREHSTILAQRRTPASFLAEESRRERQNQTPQITRDLTGRSISEPGLRLPLRLERRSPAQTAKGLTRYV